VNGTPTQVVPGGSDTINLVEQFPGQTMKYANVTVINLSRLATLVFAIALSVTACRDAPQDKAMGLEQTAASSASTAMPLVTVYKSKTCGCCTEWVSYLREEGFQVTAIDHEDMDAMKVALGLPKPELKSCHTAVVDDYLIEGHIPASDITRLLDERPADIKGLTAPGMPMYSPGMASREPKDYAVLSFTADGATKVYSQY